MESSENSLENYWTQLPCDVMLMILMKVQHLQILVSVQFVCKSRHILCKEPSLWRTIQLKDNRKLRTVENFDDDFNILCNAVDSSAGDLIDLDVECFVLHGLRSYVASRKLSSLEELDITLCDFVLPENISIIKSCPSLTTFKLNELCWRDSDEACDKVALAIAGRMHELRHLQLIANCMTNVGLMAILDGCPHLQSLDLRACFHLDLDGHLGKRLSKQVKYLRRPYDSTEDYNYPTIDHYDSDFENGSDDFPYQDDFGRYYIIR
ncbi:hypothetical protein RND81_07G165500 [Saponaria officinalis]|uniref:F-box domain-containing protein n=1 Tax=Saponaria officinalis TaxID=3572 RepID=A0AAW1JRN3_SAPOF